MSTRSLRLRTLSLAFALVCSLVSASAQKSSHISGSVTDPLGSLVPNARVELLAGDKVVASATTDADGHYDLPATSGSYKLRATAPSFGVSTTPVRLGAGSPFLSIVLPTPTLTDAVTVTATGVPTPEAQTGASVTMLPAESFRLMLEVQDPLRLVPGAQVTQSGQMGGASGLAIRGATSDANKVLIDGVPANTIGGVVNFSNIASVGFETIEVLREPDSALYGSDALAGVVSMTSTRGKSPLPLFTYAGDAGNFGTYHNEVSASTKYRQLDLFSAFSRIDTRNNIPRSEFHNATYAGNFGYQPNAANDFRFTVRHIAISAGQPNTLAFYGIADDQQQKEQDNYYNAAWNGYATTKWHNQIRYGGLRQNEVLNNFGATGIYDPAFGIWDGKTVTITGANGYNVTGKAAFQYSNKFSAFLIPTARDFVYAQSDYRVTPHFVALAGFKFENERGSSNSATATTPSAINRGNYSYTIELSGDVKNRLFYNAGTGLEYNGLFGFAGTPRASLAYYLVRPNSSKLFSGTKLHGSFGKGIKEPSIFQQLNSLNGGLLTLGLNSLATQYNVQPLGPVTSRTYDAGVDQQLFNGRGRVGVTFFHNEFTNVIQDVPKSALPSYGVSNTAVLTNFPYGAYVNGGAYRTLGGELESEYRISNHLFARGGYTYTDAVVQSSITTAAKGTNFPSVAIGAYAPLVGARPFRAAPHTGYFGLNYTQSKFFGSLTGTLVSRRDDSTYLSDSNFGNSLLLPNRNLLGSYQRVELGGGYQVTPRLNTYVNIQNLFSERYYEAFGYPALPLTFRAGLKFNFGGENWKLN